MKQTAKFAFGIAFAKILVRMFGLLKTPMKIPKMLVTKLDYGLVAFLLSINGIFKVSLVPELVNYQDCFQSRKSLILLGAIN